MWDGEEVLFGGFGEARLIFPVFRVADNDGRDIMLLGEGEDEARGFVDEVVNYI